MDKWQTRRILVLGTTYPSHSTKYRETVCTGGIFEDTLEMCRIYPIPLRYLEPAHQFRGFQWIKARVTKDMSDPRPESYRVEAQSIEPQEVISHESHGLRRSILEGSPHLCKSVEELKERQRAQSTSLGIIIPESITDCTIEMRSEAERREWMTRERARAAQEVFPFGERPKPLDFPEAKFYVHWECNDERCARHKMSLHQWGIHQLYRKYDEPEVAKEKVIQEMYRRLNQWEKDIFLFLGNFRDVMVNFGLMDSYSAPSRQAQRQGTLFT
jgi:hypothetical protein